MPTEIPLPFPPLLVLQLHGEVTWDWLEPRIRNRLVAGVSLCIVAVQARPSGEATSFTFEKVLKGLPSRPSTGVTC